MSANEFYEVYRMLDEGETIRDTDEFLDDSDVWRKTICAGEKAPNPAYTSHRQYRRRVVEMNEQIKLALINFTGLVAVAIARQQNGIKVDWREIADAQETLATAIQTSSEPENRK